MVVVFFYDLDLAHEKQGDGPLPGDDLERLITGVQQKDGLHLSLEDCTSYTMIMCIIGCLGKEDNTQNWGK